ncbi:hypothetical protein BC829DRAFT_421529 [Chytridium lagenaria]|nr:hypothetical protein BC829DRAFT_421529 [Chytridium lagenaria]
MAALPLPLTPRGTPGKGDGRGGDQEEEELDRQLDQRLEDHRQLASRRRVTCLIAGNPMNRWPPCAFVWLNLYLGVTLISSEAFLLCRCEDRFHISLRDVRHALLKHTLDPRGQVLYPCLASRAALAAELAAVERAGSRAGALSEPQRRRWGSIWYYGDTKEERSYSSSRELLLTRYRKSRKLRISAEVSPKVVPSASSSSASLRALNVARVGLRLPRDRARLRIAIIVLVWARD